MNVLNEQKQGLTDVLFTKHFIRFNFLGKRFVCNYDGSSEYWDEIKIDGERYEVCFGVVGGEKYVVIYPTKGNEILTEKAIYYED